MPYIIHNQGKIIASQMKPMIIRNAIRIWYYIHNSMSSRSVKRPFYRPFSPYAFIQLIVAQSLYFSPFSEMQSAPIKGQILAVSPVYCLMSFMNPYAVFFRIIRSWVKSFYAYIGFTHLFASLYKRFIHIGFKIFKGIPQKLYALRSVFQISRIIFVRASVSGTRISSVKFSKFIRGISDRKTMFSIGFSNLFFVKTSATSRETPHDVAEDHILVSAAITPKRPPLVSFFGFYKFYCNKLIKTLSNNVFIKSIHSTMIPFQYNMSTQ